MVQLNVDSVAVARLSLCMPYRKSEGLLILDFLQILCTDQLLGLGFWGNMDIYIYIHG